VQRMTGLVDVGGYGGCFLPMPHARKMNIEYIQGWVKNILNIHDIPPGEI
jgi:hypothetical protein